MANNKSQITRNRNIALIRRGNRRNNSIEIFLNEHFWKPEEWPNHIVNCFMDFEYTDRICISNFFFGNGLRFEDAFRIIEFYHNWNSTASRAYRYTFYELWSRLDKAINRTHPDWDKITSTYYFYSMIMRKVMFFNGNIRLHGVSINVRNNINMNRSISVPHVLIERNESEPINIREENIYDNRERNQRLNRRWQFLASIDGDPIIIDGITFRFDWSLYTNKI